MYSNLSLDFAQKQSFTSPTNITKYGQSCSISLHPQQISLNCHNTNNREWKSYIHPEINKKYSQLIKSEYNIFGKYIIQCSQLNCKTQRSFYQKLLTERQIFNKNITERSNIDQNILNKNKQKSQNQLNQNKSKVQILQARNKNLQQQLKYLRSVLIQNFQNKPIRNL